MSGFCKVDPSCVEWPRPSWHEWPCDPCLDPANNTEHRALLDRTWRLTVDYLTWKTGCVWPGSCWRETYRPSWNRGCGHPVNECDCCGVGAYRFLPVEDVTCFPIIGLEKVDIGGTGCDPCGRVLTPGDGARLEWVDGSARVVMESDTGCCGPWPGQNLCRRCGDVGTWSVSFITGCDPPGFVLEGAAAFAAEWAKQCFVNKCAPGNVSRMSFDGTTIEVDPSQPPTLSLRLLEQVLDLDPGVREFALGGPDPVSWHSVDRPARLCPELCPDSCTHSCMSCTRPMDDCDCGPGQKQWLIDQVVGGCPHTGECDCGPDQKQWLIDQVVGGCPHTGECDCGPGDRRWLLDQFVRTG